MRVTLLTTAIAVTVAAASGARAQAPIIDLTVTGEHRMIAGDTAESAKRFALANGRAKAVSDTVAAMQGRTDIAALKLTPVQLEAFVGVMLAVEEIPQASARAGSSSARVALRARLDAGDAPRRMAGLARDADAGRAVVMAWTRAQQLQQRLATDMKRRASASGPAAEPMLREQLRALDAIDATQLAARASAELARTVPSTVGGYAPSPQGRQRAKELLDAALALAPDSPEVHAAVGDFLVDAEEPEAAESEYRKALLSDGTSVVRRLKLAEALRLQGKFDAAVTELRDVLRIDPNAAQAHSDLGMVLRAQRHVPEAIAEYREAIRLDPGSADAHNGLAITLAGQGRMEDAVVEFREMVRLDPDSAIGHYNLAFALADLDRDVEAAAALREVIRINPNHYNARFNLGELFRLDGKYDESATQFREYIRLAPDTPQNQRNIERARRYIQQFTNQ